MTPIIVKALFWFTLAVVFACLEIEAEGKYGWAEKMPTWYRTRGPVAKIYGLFMGGKPLTGYHSFMFVMPLFVVHAHFVMSWTWSLSAELMAFALYLAWAPLWDYLWFVLNPAYGARRFKKYRVWWHAGSDWTLELFPVDYLIGWSISIGLSAIACFLAKDLGVMVDHLYMLLTFLGLTFLTILLSPLYHRWYSHMRKRDDRSEAKIKHLDE